ADVDIISFTGSNEVGREFLRYSADSNLKKIVLELGGKAPQIVTADNADRLAVVAEDLAEAAFGNNGQNCTAGSRILVHSSIAEDFIDELVKATNSFVVGDPLDPATTIGSLVEESALARVTEYVDAAVADGATVRAGGKRVLEETGGWFYPPTVVTDVREDMAIARDEIFGPVVVVLPFDDVADAVRIANDTPFGLAANVWSRDIDDALGTARAVRAGTVSVNGYSEGDITTRFGGYKESGFGGRDNGMEAFEQYTETMTIWVNVRCARWSHEGSLKGQLHDRLDDARGLRGVRHTFPARRRAGPRRLCGGGPTGARCRRRRHPRAGRHGRGADLGPGRTGSTGAPARGGRGRSRTGRRRLHGIPARGGLGDDRRCAPMGRIRRHGDP